MKSSKMSRRHFLCLIGKTALGTAAAYVCPAKARAEGALEDQSSAQKENKYDDEKKIRITVQDHTLMIR